MKDRQFQEAMERIKAIAAAQYSLITPEEIVGTVMDYDPEVTEEEVFALIDGCGAAIQVVSPERKEEILDAVRQAEPMQADSGADLSLIDKMFCIILRRNMAPGVRELWYIQLWENEHYRFILKNRPAMGPARLAEELGLPLEEVYRLEREMYSLYYTVSHAVREGK